jgi:hypothetical protein
MASKRGAETPPPISDQLLDPPETSLLDLLDRVLNKGVMANGDVTIGVAGVDLIYVRLAALLCAADRVLVPDRRPAQRKARVRRKRATRRPSPSRARR